MDNTDTPNEIPVESLIVFTDEHGETQVMTQGSMHPSEMRLMLVVAAAKLELVETRMMIYAAQQREAQSGLVLARGNVDRIMGL
jgi:hypothetical protein